LLSRWRGPSDRNGDLAIVWVLPVGASAGSEWGVAISWEGEQIRLQARWLPYDSRLPGVTDPMEH